MRKLISWCLEVLILAGIVLLFLAFLIQKIL